VPWKLEIHHIGLLYKDGEATLVIARHQPPGPAPAVGIRSLLIDGGKQSSGPEVESYIAANLGGPVDAIICTHYAADHMNGLRYLLRRPGICDNTVIYDQGWEGGAGIGLAYQRYLYAINGCNDSGFPILSLANLHRTRATWMVQSDPNNPPLALPAGMGAPAVPAGLAMVNQPPDWLLSANPLLDPLWHDPANPAAGPPPGAPTTRFIAVNGYVRRPPGFPGGPVAGPFLAGTDPRKVRSLAIEITFGNFRYYAGGDLENAQEAQLLPLLNPGNNVAGRVLAMKVSNHGARTSTWRPFVDQIRPAAAIVSCGNGNLRGHPNTETLNVLDGYQGLAAQHAQPPPPAPNLPVPFYLTGYEVIDNPPRPYFGDMARTSGDPLPPLIRGDVVLTVDDTQAGAPVEGQLYWAVATATWTVLTADVLGGALDDATAATIAGVVAGVAFDHGPGPAAGSVINQAGGPAAPQARMDAIAAADTFGRGDDARAMARAVTNAAIGAHASPAIAAAAGAAAGTYYGGGTALAAFYAVKAALRAVGATEPYAADRAGNMPLPVTPERFQVGYYDRRLQPHWVTNLFA